MKTFEITQDQIIIIAQALARSGGFLIGIEEGLRSQGFVVDTSSYRHDLDEAQEILLKIVRGDE